MEGQKKREGGDIYHVQLALLVRLGDLFFGLEGLDGLWEWHVAAWLVFAHVVFVLDDVAVFRFMAGVETVPAAEELWLAISANVALWMLIKVCWLGDFLKLLI